MRATILRRAPVASDLKLFIGNMRVEPSLVGLTSARVYHSNWPVPRSLSWGDVSIVVIVRGFQDRLAVRSESFLFTLRRTIV